MYAQSLVEYGAISAALTRVQQVAYSFFERVWSVTDTRWIVGAIVLIALLAFRRRP